MNSDLIETWLALFRIMWGDIAFPTLKLYLIILVIWLPVNLWGRLVSIVFEPSYIGKGMEIVWYETFLISCTTALEFQRTMTGGRWPEIDFIFLGLVLVVFTAVAGRLSEMRKLRQSLLTQERTTP